MDRVFKINGNIINIDNWCENNITEETDLIEALNKCINCYPELEAFKAQVRSNIRYWKNDKKCKRKYNFNFTEEDVDFDSMGEVDE